MRDVGLARGYFLESSQEEVDDAISIALKSGKTASDAEVRWKHISCRTIFQTRYANIRDHPTCPYCDTKVFGDFQINPSFDLHRLEENLYDYVVNNPGRLPFKTTSNDVRISSFSSKLRISGVNSLGDKFSGRYVREFIQRTKIKVTLVSDSSVKKTIEEYNKGRVENVPTSIKLISLAQKFNDHDKCVYHSLKRIKNIIVKELPIFDPQSTENKLTGHIDLLAFEEDGYLVVWDFKPKWKTKDWSPNPNKKVTENFIQFLPQIAAYAITLMTQLGLKGVKCGIFNSEGTWEFDPYETIRILNSDFPTARFPWREFKILDLK